MEKKTTEDELFGTEEIQIKGERRRTRTRGQKWFKETTLKIYTEEKRLAEKVKANRTFQTLIFLKCAVRKKKHFLSHFTIPSKVSETQTYISA